MHLLLNHFMWLSANIKVQYNFIDPSSFYIFQTINYLRRGSNENWSIRQVFLLRIPQNLIDFHEIMHGRRHLTGIIREGTQHTILEIIDLVLSSTVFFFGRISNINKIATEISSDLIKRIIGSEVNMSNVSAIVKEISKKTVKNIWQ